MTTPRRDAPLRIVAILAVVVLGVIGFTASTSVLGGGLAWLGFLFFVLSGWGFVVVRAARVADPDVGMRAVWGACGYLAVAGGFLALNVLSRPVILGLIGIGVAGFAWRELTTPVASWCHVRDAVRFVRTRPALGWLAVVVVGFAVVRIVGAVATLDRNPWDDDIAYTPLVKRLLDTGDLVEPFSFRRLGAYGGQTVLQALAGARGSLSSVHLIDKGLCFGLALLLLAGHARAVKTQPLWTVVVALVLLMMPDTAINTASYWSGVAMFVCLYRTVVDEHWLLAGLVGGATCTLRQNYLAIAAVFLGLALLSRLIVAARTVPWGEAWRGERRRWLLGAGLAAAVLVPYWIASYRSSGTFLFPIMEGTWNASVSLRATAPSWADELQFLVWCFIESQPLVILPPVLAVILFSTDTRPTRPVIALLLASTLGLVLMVVSFVGSDANHLWRYAFPATITVIAMFALEIGAEDASPPRLAPLGRWVLLASLLLQLVVQRDGLAKRYATLFGDIQEARHGDPTAAVEQRRYAALQASAPAGARLLVMLDDPAHLDFGRNPIANLDTPGYASPGPGLPAFAGPEALRTYLLGEGIRHVAFVRSEHSRYFYRRPFWIWRIFNDAEIFQVMSAYTLDAIDSLAALATTSTVLHDVDGLVMLDLGTAPLASPRDDRPEPVRRAAYVRALADREGLHAAWSLNTRDDVLFEDGVTGLVFVDERVDDPAWYDVLHTATTPPTRGTAARWLYRRAHLRVRGATDMHLVARGKVNLGATYTRPRLDVSLDGALLTTVIVDEQGGFTIDVVVPATQLGDAWRDLYLVFGSIAEPQRDVRELRAARLESLEWEPR